MNVTVEALTHVFPGRPPRAAVQDLSFTVPSGQFVAIVGPSGCGKSTLLRLVANLLRPGSGSIRLDGQSPEQVVAQRELAWMAQSPALLPWLSARSNVALAGRFLPKNAARLTPEQALATVGLSDSAHAYPFMLSGGMQQRLALARTLTLPARLWLMDEPFAALDELTRERLSAELLELWQPLRPTVLWITHNLYEAVRLADRVLVLSERPAHVTGEVWVNLPRPRDDTSPTFLKVVRQIRQTLSQ